MKEKLINPLAVLQMVGACALGLFTLTQFRLEVAWFLIGCIAAFLAALGLTKRSKVAFVAEFLLLTPVCGLLLFQTGRRIWGIFTGIWMDCPPAYMLGFFIEQMMLIPALLTAAVLLLCRSSFWRPQAMGS